MSAKTDTWCDRDEHRRYDCNADFNDWLDSEDCAELRARYRIDGISQPSKAFFAGDREAYDQVFELYRQERRHEVLNGPYLREQFSDDHWLERNLQRFDQLMERLAIGAVVPFIGAGLSKAGGFPTWEEHLRQQGRTAGLDPIQVSELLGKGQFESVIEEIENKRGRDVFVQEIRDAFSRTGTITDTTLLISELFTDTVITTNYDRLLEQVYDIGVENPFQVIAGTNALAPPVAGPVTILKLHGDIREPSKCILGKGQYDNAYGPNGVDMSLAIPKLLEYYFRNSSLLFLGCSLNNDRTIEVFRAIKEKIGTVDLQHFVIEAAPEDEQALVDRNEYLLRLGITGIWFEQGRYETIDEILQLARNELHYRKAF